MSTWLCLVAQLGCDYLPERPPMAPPKANTSVADQAKAELEVVEAPLIRFEEDWESWYGYYRKDKQIGYSHISARRLIDLNDVRASNANVQHTVDDQVTLRRGKSTFIQHLTQTSTETPEGQLLNFESVLKVGPVVSKFHGHIAKGQLTVETLRGTARTTKRIPWQSTYRGLVAVEESLRRKPMEKGDKRILKMLLPIQHKVASIQLYCSGSAAVAQQDGSFAKMIEIVSQEKIDEGRIAEQVIWTDEQGVIQKMLRPAIELVAFRTDKETAQAKIVPIDAVMQATAIRVDDELERSDEAKQVAFVLSPLPQFLDDEISVSIPVAPDQFVRKLSDQTSHVLVSRKIDATPEGFASQTLPVVDADKTANSFIDSSSALVRRIAAAAVRGELGERELALELTRTTNNLMQTVPRSQGFSKASGIAQSAQGDCMEYSILLAALLRAKGIPSRLAIGLKYEAGEAPRMVFHVWTLAHVDGQWLTLDGLVGGIPPADRLTFATTNLSGGNEYEIITPVLDLMSQIDIQVKAATY
ncbi:MAG: transglutaminase domain-containing protein [Pirellulaceae bacterium]|nr:transglutaminase domain-containing protein [Pirellulaceae bacterium]